jgi:hypothetical protein
MYSYESIMVILRFLMCMEGCGATQPELEDLGKNP